jgi:hypothetical protein
MIKQNVGNYSVIQLAQMQEEGTIHFDHAIQRNEVWDDEKDGRKSLFIHSVLYGYPIGLVYALDEGDNDLWFLDGKQRISTILSFIQDGFILREDTPDIDGEIVAKQAFSQLSEALQLRIKTFNFMVIELRGLEDYEIDAVFYRLNNGMPLTKMELTRVLGSSKIMEFVKEVSETEFFNDKMTMTEKKRNRFEDEELVLQTMMLISNDMKPVELGSDQIREYAINMKKQGIPMELQQQMMTTSEYLNNAFPESESFLKKVHVPILFCMAVKAQNKEIDPAKFGGWAQEFFKLSNYKGSTYATNASSGTGREAKVRKRLEEMSKDFLLKMENIDQVPNWKTKEERQKEADAEKARKRAEAEAKKQQSKTKTKSKTTLKDMEEAKKEEAKKEEEKLDETNIPLITAPENQDDWKEDDSQKVNDQGELKPEAV